MSDGEVQVEAVPGAAQAAASPWDRRWFVRTNEINYGPYTGHQMRAFIAEGRVAASTLVAAEGDSAWHRAGSDVLFAPLFVPAGPPAPKQSVLAVRARLTENEERQPTGFGTKRDSADPNDVSNFVIIMDLKSRGSAKLEQFIMEMGPATRLNPNVWMVSGPHTIGTVRNQLVQFFGSTDSFIVVDATHNKIAWFNMGPEIDARINRVWRN